MSKPATVADAMQAMAAQFSTTKPEPTEVKIVTEKLRPAELGQLLLSLIIGLPIRALAVWAVLAIFFPALGLTYIAVLAVLWAIPHAMPPKVADMAKGIIARRK
jgi:F0F1-type ATP synthase assembly protein I